MPSRISDNIKSIVIEQWLAGDQRDKIAANNTLSAGAVTNIVNEWQQNLGIPLAKDLRELAITLRKSRLSPNRCALGHRIAMILARLGVKDEDFESFVSQIYNDSKRIIELPSEKIASHLTDLVKISRNMSPSEVKSDIEQKINQKRTLEKQLENLSAQIEELEKQKSDIKEQYDTALKKERMAAASLSWYSDLRVELMKYHIQVDDIQLFVQTIRNIQQYDYNVKEVISEFSDLKLLNDKKRALAISVKELEDKAGILGRDCSVLEQLVTSYNQKLSLYNELEAMGLGLKELKLLWHTIREIAEANNIPLDQAPQKFYKDIEEQYDDKLGLELKINELRSEISTVSINLNASRTALLAQPLVASSLQRLFSKGVVEQDIVEFANLFDRSYDDSSYKSTIE
jgi:hypothetical protein